MKNTRKVADKSNNNDFISVNVPEDTLYDTIIQSIQNNIEQDKQPTIDLRTLATTLNSLNRTMKDGEALVHYNAIALLAIRYNIDKNGGVIDRKHPVPPKFKVQPNGIGLYTDLSQLDVELQMIIAEYVTMFSDGQ